MVITLDLHVRVAENSLWLWPLLAAWALDPDFPPPTPVGGSGFDKAPCSDAAAPGPTFARHVVGEWRVWQQRLAPPPLQDGTSWFPLAYLHQGTGGLMRADTRARWMTRLAGETQPFPQSGTRALLIVAFLRLLSRGLRSNTNIQLSQQVTVWQRPRFFWDGGRFCLSTPWPCLLLLVEDEIETSEGRQGFWFSLKSKRSVNASVVGRLG